jgi:hypothetical protein
VTAPGAVDIIICLGPSKRTIVDEANQAERALSHWYSSLPNDFY